MKAYADIADFDEGTRIETIGRYVMSHRTEKVAFITDAEPGKADRYIERLKTRFPEIIVFGRSDGPIPTTVTISVGVKPKPCDASGRTPN